MTYIVLDTSEWELAGDENEGSTAHDWLRSPTDGDLYLWKPATDRRLSRREHLAEKIASELAVVFGVPSAQVELATRHGTSGCLSRNVQARKSERRSGAQLLRTIDASFQPDVQHVAYTIDNIARVLDGIGPPISEIAALAGFTAFDVFAGYLTFDALILNRDRHAANWAVWQPRDGGLSHLFALFDNASSFALSMAESKAANRVASGGVDAYVRREDHARRFSLPSNDPRLVDVAASAHDRCRSEVRDHWKQRIAAVEMEHVTGIVEALDELSAAMRTLVTQVVMANRRRLLDEL